jgi:glutamyl-tRNA synthetase
MAPSPTGPLHIGTARTALFNWLFARKYGGTFVLRVEDTDKERSEEKYEREILEGLSWLGLDWDEGPSPTGNHLPGMDEKGPYGPYRQSARTEIYKKYLQELLDKGNAYYCYCTKDDIEAQRAAMATQGLPLKYSGHCRNLAEPPAGQKPEVIRFKVPEIKVEFKDMVRGKVVFDATLFGDIVIAKDIATPLYNFAVVVDDELMKISHVIRGEDHLSNTPKQILMQRALGFAEPIYAHIPLILNPDRSKMSKRLSDTALSQYREKGYFPEALLNFLALLGWHPKDDREILSAKDLIAEFDIDRVQQAGAVFNPEKLDWVNREYIKKLSDKEIAQALAPMLAREYAAITEDFLMKFVAVTRTRANTLRDLLEYGRFFFTPPEYEPGLLVWKDSSKEEARTALAAVRAELAKLPAETFQKEALQEAVRRTIGDGKRGVVLWPLRVALSGLKASPDPIDIMTVLGKDEAIKRIDTAAAKL